MANHVKLVNMTDVLKENSLSAMSQERMIEMLNSIDEGLFEFYSIGAGKGGRVMIRPQNQSTVVRFIKENGKPLRMKLGGTMRVIPMEERIVPPETIEELRAEFTNQLRETVARFEDNFETQFLEQEERVDALHQAVEAIARTYEKLRSEVDPAKELPAAPTLPPKYRYKILLIGNEEGMSKHLADNFREIKFIHIGAGRMDENRWLNIKQWPRADLAIIMTSFVGHEMMYRAKKTIPGEKITYVKGSTSSAESVISLWLRQQEEKKA